MSLFSITQTFQTEDEAHLYWMTIRFPNGIRCLACDCAKCYLIETKGKTGKVARLFECSDCGLHFSSTTGTLFHDSHLPLRKWFMAIALMVEGKKGISASQVRRHIGVTYKTAWYLCHRIREAMQEDPKATVGGANVTVEIDEMYVGGRKRLQGHKAGFNAKTVVLGLAERQGNIHMQTVSGAKTEVIREALDKKLDSETPTVITDGKSLYRKIIPNRKHIGGNHKEELKDKNYSSTYTVESAFFPLQAGYRGELSPSERRPPKPLSWRILLEIQPPIPAKTPLPACAGESGESEAAPVQSAHLRSVLDRGMSFSGRGLDSAMRRRTASNAALSTMMGSLVSSIG